MTTKPYLTVLLAVFALLSALGGPAPAQAATSFTVNSTLDEPDAAPGNGACASVPSGLCTLRAAIMETNAGNQGLIFDVIVLPASPAPYQLTRPGYDDNAESGDLDITGYLVISGAGAANTIIDGNYLVTGDERVFTIAEGSSVNISGVTIQNGRAGDYPSINQPAGGGGIYNAGHLTLNGVVVTGNSALYQSQYLYPRGGGGIFNDFDAELTLINSTVSDNTDFGPGGGGIYNLGVATLRNSIVSGNAAEGGGGGIDVSSGSLTLINSTISGNTAYYGGGGLAVGNGSAQLYNSTVTGNTARLGSQSTNGSGGGGIYVGPNETATLQNTIIAGNLDDAFNMLWYLNPHDCDGALISNGHNLLGRTNGCSGIVAGTNGDLAGAGLAPLAAGLGSLADNGGPTQTHALLAGSPAIDAGNPFNCTDVVGAPLPTDQRGFARTADGDGANGARCDIGAFEFSQAVYQVFVPIVVK